MHITPIEKAAIAVIIITLIGMGYVLSELDFSGGVKPVVEQVWCGKPDCLNQ